MSVLETVVVVNGLGVALVLGATRLYIAVHRRRRWRARESTLGVVDECDSCGEVPEGECATSWRPCGHHCNHSWSHDRCCWCNRVFDEEDGA